MDDSKPTSVERAIFEFVQACDETTRAREAYRRAKAARDEMIEKVFGFIRKDPDTKEYPGYDEGAITRYASVARHQIERSRSVFALPKEGGDEDGG